MSQEKSLREALVEFIARMRRDAELNHQQAQKLFYSATNRAEGWAEARRHESGELERLLELFPVPVVKSENLPIWEARGFTYAVNNPDKAHLSFEKEKGYFKNDPERHAVHKRGFDKAHALMEVCNHPEVVDAAVKVVWQEANDHKKSKKTTS